MLLAICLALASSAVCGQHAGGLIVAVLEQNNFEDQRAQIGAPDRRLRYRQLIRPLFTKSGSEWNEMTAYPAAIRLYPINQKSATAINGALCPSPGEGWGAQYYGVYMPARNWNGPWRGFPEPDQVFEDKDIIRFQVLTAKPGVTSGTPLAADSLNDTDRIAIADSVVQRLKDYSRQHNPGLFHDSVYLFFRQSYLDGLRHDASSVQSVFRDSRGNKLVTLVLPLSPFGITGSAFSLDGFREDNGTFPRLLGIIKPGGRVKLFFADMQLLDHAVFDGDGLEEYLFFYSMFNHYGYLLVYDNFSRYVSHTWRYH